MSPPPPPPVAQHGWRPSGSTVFIVLGVLAYLGLRQLPPDNSLERVRQADTLRVCVPSDFPPYLTGTDSPEVGGSEARLLGTLSRSIGVPIQWNLQPAWGTSPDPVDWGIRPESCDLLAGGIVVGDETQGMLQLLPYAQTHWALLSHATPPKHLAVFSGHWGLHPDDALDWADAQKLDFLAYDDLGSTLAALKSGERDSVLTLRPEADWLAAQLGGAQVRDLTGLPAPTLALGMWKNNITLKRALLRELSRNGFGLHSPNTPR